MKKLLFMAGLVLLAVSCTNDSSDFNNENNEKAHVTVSVSGFSMSQEEFPATRTVSPVASYDGIKSVTLAFYSGSTEMYKSTQTKGSMPAGSTFGNFSLDLPLGSYTMVVLGYVLYDDDELTLSSPTQAEYTVNAPRETFATTQAVNITSTDAVNLSATLDRIVTKLQVVSTDGRTANANKVRMTFSAGSKRFSPTTGLATLNAGSVSTVNISTAVGATSSSIGYVFLSTDEQTMNVTIETLDAEGNTIYSTVVNNVPFKRNRCTKLTGSLYPTAATGSAISVETDWLSDHNISF